MVKIILPLVVFLFSISSKAAVQTTVSCKSSPSNNKREIEVKRDGDRVRVTIGKILREYNSALFQTAFDDSEFSKLVRSKYASGELFKYLKTRNSSVNKDTLTIDFGKGDCTFNPVDSRVVRCMNDGLSMLIESPLTRTVSANGIDIISKNLTILLSIPMPGIRYTANIELMNLLVSSNIRFFDAYIDCK